MIHLFLPLVLLVNITSGGLIQHSDKATSYQNFEIEHFHAVPTYVKHEDKELLDHPISAGKTATKVEIHHGDKHDPGYAYTNAENEHHSIGLDGGQINLEGLENGGPGEQYQHLVQENTQEYLPQYEVNENDGYEQYKQLEANGNENYEQYKQLGNDENESYDQYKQLAEAAIEQFRHHMDPSHYIQHGAS